MAQSGGARADDGPTSPRWPCGPAQHVLRVRWPTSCPWVRLHPSSTHPAQRVMRSREHKRAVSEAPGRARRASGGAHQGWGSHRRRLRTRRRASERRCCCARAASDGPTTPENIQERDLGGVLLPLPGDRRRLWRSTGRAGRPLRHRLSSLARRAFRSRERSALLRSASVLTNCCARG